MSLYKLLQQRAEPGLAPVRCAEVMLKRLSRMVEERVLTRRIPALIFSGFQPASYWEQEIEHYWKLAQVARQICIFTDAPLSLETETFFYIILGNDSPLRQEQFTVILSEPLSIALCGQGYQATLETEAPRQCETLWSFEPETVQLGLDLLEDVIAAHRPERLAQLRASRANYSTLTPDPALITTFTMELMRLEEQWHEQPEVTSQNESIPPPALQQRERNERQQMEEALRESRRFIEHIADTIPTILYLHDIVEDNNLYINRQITTTLGYSPEALREMRYVLKKLIHPDDYDRVVESNMRLAAAKDGEVVEVEYRMKHANGQWRWLWARDTVFNRTVEGRPWQILGTIQDITERKQAEEEKEQLSKLLAAEHQRLKSLMDYLPAGVVLLNAEKRIVLTNRMAQKFLEELTGVTVGHKLTYLGGQPFETILTLHPAGRPYEVKLAGFPTSIFEVVTERMGDGWILVIRDVTEEHAAQQRIQQQGRLAAVGQLAAGIAHDFNNILTSITGYAELLRTDPTTPPLAKQDLERIVQQSRRAARLIRQVLDFTRRSVVEKQPLDLIYFLKENIKLLERTIPENIRIILEIKLAEYICHADPIQIQQVLTNLALNARDAMPAGGLLQFRLSHLTFRSGELPPFPDMLPGEWIILTIADTGVGIPPEQLPYIFEPFFTTKEVGKGSGLGLAQVHGIIKQHEGYIQVESQVGQGTTFSLFLPTLTSSSPIPALVARGEAPQGQSEVILLVEDDLATLEVTQIMLERLGYRVLVATNGQAALEIYDRYRHKIALVLTDMTMPEIGGLELTLALRQKNPALKIMALSGYSLEGEIEELTRHGISFWLQKPLSLEQLAQAMKRVLKSADPSF